MSESLIFSSSRWILACAVLFSAAVLGPDAHAQVNPGACRRRHRGPRSTQCVRGSKGSWRRSIAASAAPETRPGTNRSVAIRTPLPSSRPNLSASPRRPSGWAATVPDFSRCLTASRPNAVRSTTRFSRCGPISIRSRPASSGCAAGASAAPIAIISAARSCWRWRRIIAGRNTPMPCKTPATS